MRYCWAAECKEIDSGKCSLSFHTFPKDTELRQQWIVATGRDKQPGNSAVLCSKHFSPEDYEPTKKRSKLKATAIPSIFSFNKENVIFTNQHMSSNIANVQSAFMSQECNGLKKQVQCIEKNLESASYSNVQLREQNINDSTNRTVLSEEQQEKRVIWNPKHLKQVKLEHLETPRRRARCWSQAMSKITILEKRTKVLQEEKRRLIKKVFNFENILKDLKEKGLLTENTAAMMSSLPELHKELIERESQSSKGHYSPILRRFVITLQFYSAKAYDFVRREFNNSLPHPSTIRRWYQHINGKPGFTTEAFESLKATVDENAEKKKKTYV